MHTIVPIFVCVVLPVSIVLIVFLAVMNSDNKRAQVLMKAIESGNGVDADRLAEALRKPQKSAKEILNLRLLRGCIFTLIGVILAVVGILSWAFGTVYSFSDDQVVMPIMLGGISLAVGISYLIVYFTTRNQVK